MVTTRMEDITGQLASLKELLERQHRQENERAWQQLEVFEGGTEDEYYDFADKFQTTLEDASLPNILAWGPLDEESQEEMKEEQRQARNEQRQAYGFVSKRIALKLRVKTKGLPFGIVKNFGDDGVAAWTALRDHYEPRLVSRQLILRQQYQ
eukprot:54567-Eustigmatos_ZCMA.PRE.1